MKRAWLAMILLAALAGCQAGCQGKTENQGGAETEVHMGTATVTFLTREGCPKSPAMEANLRAALKHRGWTGELIVLDLGDLPADDPRTGYGTPTALVDGVDLFGRATPGPATPT